MTTIDGDFNSPVNKENPCSSDKMCDWGIYGVCTAIAGAALSAAVAYGLHAATGAVIAASLHPAISIPLILVISTVATVALFGFVFGSLACMPYKPEAPSMNNEAGFYWRNHGKYSNF